MFGKGTKVLCLSGGGVKGLSSLLILKKVGEILRQAFEEAGHPELMKDNFRPCTYFDIIIGTSTGGIIALMLARVGVTIQECITGYEEFSKHVFGGSTIVTWGKFVVSTVRRNDGHGHRFDRSNLEKAAQKFLETHGLSMDTPLQVPGFATCKAILVTARRTKEYVDKSNEPHPIRRRISELVGLSPDKTSTEHKYKLKAHLLCSDASGHGKGWTLGDAILATTSAYGIFPPFYKEGEVYDDAERNEVVFEDAALIGLNNPAALKGPLQPLIRGLDSHMPQALFLNIGAGTNPGYCRLSRLGKLLFLKGQITETGPAMAAAEDLHNARREKSYFAISGPSELREISVHDHHRLPEIARVTEAHLEDVDTLITMRSVAECFIKIDCDWYIPEPDECHLGSSSRGCLLNESSFTVLNKEIHAEFIERTIESLGPRFQTYQGLVREAKEMKRRARPNALTDLGVNASTRRSLVALKEELQNIISLQSQLCDKTPDFPSTELLVTTAHLLWATKEYDPTTAKAVRYLLHHLLISEEIERAQAGAVAPCQEISELDHALARAQAAGTETSGRRQ